MTGHPIQNSGVAREIRRQASSVPSISGFWRILGGHVVQDDLPENMVSLLERLDQADKKSRCYDEPAGRRRQE